MFCFGWDNKQTKSKRFALVPIISRPNQNILLQFWKKADKIKMFCFRSNNKGTKSKPFASIYKFFYYIGTFCFASDNFWTNQIGSLRPRTYGPKRKRTAFDTKKFGPNKNLLLPFRSDLKRTKSKRFAYVPIISFLIGAFLLSFRYRWHYYPRPISIICHIRDPPTFSLPTTFKVYQTRKCKT